MLKKRFKYIDKKPSEILFARYDEARAKLNTVYRVYRLTAYSGNSLYLFEICIYKYTHIYIYIKAIVVMRKMGALDYLHDFTM